MLDFADIVAINKFDRKGSQDAYRDVCKQVQRNRQMFDVAPNQMPVFGTMASRFNDDGLTALYQHLLGLLNHQGLNSQEDLLPIQDSRISSNQLELIPAKRVRYLSEIAEAVREYKRLTETQSVIARERQQLQASIDMLLAESSETDTSALGKLVSQKQTLLDRESLSLLEQWPEIKRVYLSDSIENTASGGNSTTALVNTSLSGNRIPRISVPRYVDHGELLKWLRLDNLPGYFPYTSGVFPLKRENEDPTRMFAGEGDAFRTNNRFKQLSEHAVAKRLSTAFDSVTLYGCDPDERPDIYGKVGNSGVSIATLDDMKELYAGFDLCHPMTSVSMTINGPAPVILAMFLNTAIDQQIAEFADQNQRPPDEKFSTEFALKLMGDIQEYFVEHEVRNFYSVSISGYHIAEAGANPISQLAFTLSNGFTFVESYLARGMDVDDFAANLSFFFSNGMDPEYSVMGRVARRIWAVAMRDRYGASSRSQKLKYHIQTSGRSLHAQEMDFNDIRTTLQALIAIYDNCNSLHTNAFDEAITTPTEDSVRRALAIQLIINQEWGLAMNENPNQGSFIIEELTELVEEAVLLEFERISERGGVLGAMETGYQRGKIQDESLEYEHRKHSGSLPIVGVNTFVKEGDQQRPDIELARSSEQEKQNQILRLRSFQAQHKSNAEDALQEIKNAVIFNNNIFSALVGAVRYCSLGQISDALYQVGGQYRRNM